MKITSTGKLEGKSMTELAEIYNSVPGTKRIIKFRDKETAIKRTLEALSNSQGTSDQEQGKKILDRKGGLTKKNQKTKKKLGSGVRSGEVTPASKKKSSRRVTQKAGGKAVVVPRKRKLFDLEPKSVVKSHREDTKRADLIRMLLDQGATREQVMKRFQWTSTDAQQGISLLHKSLGWGIKEAEDGVIRIRKTK